MSEEEQRIRKAAGRTGGYSRSVIAGDLRVVIAELDALRLRAARLAAALRVGDDEMDRGVEAMRAKCEALVMTAARKHYKARGERLHDVPLGDEESEMHGHISEALHQIAGAIHALAAEPVSGEAAEQ